MATATAAAKRRGNGSPVSASDIEAQIAQIRGDIAELGKVVSAYGTGKAKEMKGRADAASSDIADSSREALASLRSEFEALESDLRARVREKPVQALGIAAGIGFLVALLARR
ncbi:MAG: YqjD family protein [Flavobacteriaceae bacterium]